MLHTCSACSDLIMAAIRGHVDCRVVENPFSRWLAAIKTGKKIMVRKLFPSSNQQGHKKNETLDLNCLFYLSQEVLSV